MKIFIKKSTYINIKSIFIKYIKKIKFLSINFISFLIHNIKLNDY